MSILLLKSNKCIPSYTQNHDIMIGTLYYLKLLRDINKLFIELLSSYERTHWDIKARLGRGSVLLFRHKNSIIDLPTEPGLSLPNHIYDMCNRYILT